MSNTVEKNKRKKMPDFKTRFNRLRGEMSQDAFAKKLGISRPTVGSYINGDRLPDATIIKIIAEKCDVSSDWLLGLTDDSRGDISVMEIEKELKLTAGAIYSIKDCDYDLITVLNFILKSEHFSKLLSGVLDVKRAKIRHEYYSKLPIDELEEIYGKTKEWNYTPSPHFTWNKSDARLRVLKTLEERYEFLRWSTSKVLDNILEDEIDNMESHSSTILAVLEHEAKTAGSPQEEHILGYPSRSIADEDLIPDFNDLDFE